MFIVKDIEIIFKIIWNCLFLVNISFLEWFYVCVIINILVNLSIKINFNEINLYLRW